MPKFVGQRKKSLGRSGTLWERARKACLSRSQICWICAGECPDFKWDTLPFGTAAIDFSLEWPHPASKSVDHVIPIEELAPDDPMLWRQENLKPAHLKCNSARGVTMRNKKHKKKVLCKTSRDWLA